jgi:hypothetical protein
METEARRRAEGHRTFYKPEFTTKQVYDTFSNSNLDSDWESTDFFSLDTEMVLMEFIEGIPPPTPTPPSLGTLVGGLARAAWLRHNKARKGGEDTERLKAAFPAALDKFLADCSARFPYWNRYQSILDQTIKGWGEHQGKRT